MINRDVILQTLNYTPSQYPQYSMHGFRMCSQFWILPM